MKNDSEKYTRLCPIRRIDADKQIVFAEVYAPYVLDTYGEFMLPDDIETMAHRFMGLDLSQVIDTNHDNVPNGSRPVESFIARADDPDFTEGAWVLGVYIPEVAVWSSVIKGDLNCYSFEAMVRPVNYITKVATVRDHVTATKAEKHVDHEHMVFFQIDDRGLIRRGITSKAPDGHFHTINRASFTEKSGTDGHSHRYDLF